MVKRYIILLLLIRTTYCRMSCCNDKEINYLYNSVYFTANKEAKITYTTSVATALTFRHRASCILGQAFHYSPENAFYIFNQQIYFNI